MSRPVVSTSWGLLLVALLAACGPPEPAPTMRVVHERFVDAEHALPFLPTVAIADDTRFVLGPFRNQRLDESITVEVSQAGRLRLELSSADLRTPGEPIAMRISHRAEEDWVPLSPQLAMVELGEDGARVVDVELHEFAGQEVQLHAQTFGPLASGEDAFEHGPVQIPARARLEFSKGLLQIEPEATTIRFTVAICPDAELTAAPECKTVFDETLASGSEQAAGWTDHHVSLAEWEEQSVSVRFETRVEGTEPSPYVYPVWANPTVTRIAERPAGARNFILVSLDTLRADHLPSYGYPVNTAPFLDEAFAQRGTLFVNPVASAATTAVSHMSIFTGLHGLEHQVANLYRMLSPKKRTLAEMLRGAGFETGAVTENGALLMSQGFGRGFNSYRENKEADVTSFAGQAERTLALAEGWLRLHREKPFFLFIHTYQVHFPYTPPPEYDALIPSLPDEVAPPDDIPEERHPLLYDREIRYLDDLLRSFFSRLEDLGLDEDTIVVITSDHGDEFYEHDYLDHGATVFNSAVYVPLIFRGPAIAQGRRIEEPVSHVDIAPTILELAGVEPGHRISGRSLAGAFGEAGEIGRGESRRAVYLWSETRARWVRRREVEGNLGPHKTPTVGVRSGDLKAVRQPPGISPTFLYYDLASDPQEQNALDEAAAADYRVLRELLKLYPIRYRRAKEAYLEEGTAEMELEAERQLGEDPEHEAQLRALGYIE